MSAPTEPIVKGATHSVHCPCGFAHDVKAASGDEAIAAFKERHSCAAEGLMGVVDLKGSQHTTKEPA